MEYIIILALAVFLLTSAGQRQSAVAPPRNSGTPAQQTLTGSPLSPSSMPVSYKDTAAYEPTDAGKIRTFIRKYQKKAPEYQIDSMANATIKYGKVYDIDPKLLAALIARESGFDPRATSATGAMGLGQIKAFHYTRLGITDPYDIEQNTKGTAQLLRELLNKWSSHAKPVDMALAEYTEGMTALADKTYTAKTQKYIDEIFVLQKEMK